MQFNSAQQKKKQNFQWKLIPFFEFRREFNDDDDPEMRREENCRRASIMIRANDQIHG